MNEMQRTPGTPAFDVPRPEHRGRVSAGLIIALVAVSWLLLLTATAQPLLASIQLAALGLGGLVTAVIGTIWRQS